MDKKILKEYIDIIRFNKNDELLNGDEPIKIPGKQLIIVDIQPVYDKGMPFTIEQFIKSLKGFEGDILYFYNGAQMGLDKGKDLINWFMASVNDYSVDFRNLLKRIRWVEKGYGFFRDSMDEGYKYEDIEIILLYLLARKYWATNELSEKEIDSLMIEDRLKVKLKSQEHIIAVPNFDINILREYNGATMCGGGKDECYAEIKIIMNALGLKYNEFKPFIY